MARLDRSRPFAEIWGAGLTGYEQDGRLFDLRGEPYDGIVAAAPIEAATENASIAIARLHQAAARRR